jgi:hypothetical protein
MLNSEMGDLLQVLKHEVLRVEPAPNGVVLLGRITIFVVFFFWGWSFILMDFQANDIGSSFMHVVNLVFHEAGHILFRPFGRFMTILGGSLAQLLMPLIVMAAFIVQNRDTFGASLGLWWLGQSLMDLAPS